MDARTDLAIMQYWKALDEFRGDQASSATFRKLRNQFAHAGVSWATAPQVVEFMAEVLRVNGTSTALDPSAQLGLLLASLQKRVPLRKSVGITQHVEAQALRVALEGDSGPKFIIGDPLQELTKLTEKFDAVLGELPVGDRLEECKIAIGGQPQSVRLARGDQIILRALPLLSKDGVGLFVVAPNFLWSPSSAAGLLAAAGVSVSAFIELPAGTYAPWTSMPFGLLLLSRRLQEKVFVGALSESDERNRLLLRNLHEGKPGSDPALGALLDLGEFRGLRVLQLQEKITRLARPLGATPVRLSSIASAINRTSGAAGFDDHPNCLYLPLIGNSRAVASLSDMKLKSHNYAQVVLDPEKADARFTAALLSTELGLLLREGAESGVTIPKLTKATIAEMPVYLPSLEAQLKVLEADTRVTTVLSEAQALRDQLWARPRDVARVTGRLAKLIRNEQSTDWIDDLPFPLATVAWAWNATGDDLRRRCDTLVHFFEAYAEFTATLLLSAFANDVELFETERTTIRAQLLKSHASVVRSSFGTWVRIVELLAKRGRALLHGSEDEQRRCFGLFRIQNRAFVEGLLSGPIVGILQEANGRRNSWLGHAGALGDQEAQSRHVVLAGYLANLREALGGAWDGVALVRPTNRSRFSGGIFHYEVSRLMGTRTPFTKCAVELVEPLEDEQLYLLSDQESRGLKVLPLVRIMASPESAQNACYFYNRQQDGLLRFISYHFEQESELTRDFPDTADALRSVFPEDFPE